MNNSTMEWKGMPEEQRNLADFSDVHSETNKKEAVEEESSLGGIEHSSWNSVYKPTTVTLKYERRPGFSRYLQSLQHILPVRANTGSGSYMPVDLSGCCAFTFFSWLTPLVWRTFRRGLTKVDLYHISPLDSCTVNGARFSTIWHDEVKKNGLHNTPLSQPLFLFIRTRFLFSCLMYILCVAFGFVGPTLFMRLLLEYLQSPSIDHVEGSAWMLSLIACEFFRIMFFALMWAVNIRTALRASSAVKSLVYCKIMKLQTVENTSIGELINLFANDCQKVFMMVYNSPLIIGGPLVIIGAVIYTWWLIGPFCFVGVGVFVASYGLQAGISYLIARVRTEAIKATDERVSLMSEFLNNIKLIKLYAWERPLVELIRDARAVERNYLERCSYLHVMSSSISSTSSVIATVFTILAYTLCGHDLTPAEAFTLVVVNTVASHGVVTLPICIRDLINGTVALSRLQAILHLDDRESYISLPNTTGQVVNISNATLVWEQVLPDIQRNCKVKKGEVNLTIVDNEKAVHHDEVTPETALVTLQSESGLPPALVDINFILPKGKLIGVCGNVGSGKSSLISAILGQMRLLKGHVAVRGSVAYVSQQPWIMNTTLRENILFGQLFSSKRYYEAVYCCGLTDDIAALPGGDQTEVSEKGTTLSGGQKQRTSLARAQYADKDIYLLDDPLSAVDSQMGRHIFQHCIKGALKEKTILLVTNQIKYLRECDNIYLMRDGHIIEQGTHKELISRESEYSMLVDVFSKDESFQEGTDAQIPPSGFHSSVIEDHHSRSTSPSIPESMSDLDEGNIMDGHLVADEKIASGQVSWETYLLYIQAAGGFIVCALVLVWFVLQAASVAFSKYWLSYWFSQGTGNSTFDDISITQNPNLEMFQLVYGLSTVVMFTITVILGFLFTKTSLRSSSALHDNILQKVFRSPMHFFDTTPTGRILNVFTRDTDEIDNTLPSIMNSFLHKIMRVIFALLLVVVVYHWFVLPMLVMSVCFIFIQRLFRATMRDLKRLENVSRAPIYTHVGVTIQGLSTIKAFEKQDDFLFRFSDLVDDHASPQYLYYCSLRWLGTRMDLLCLIITIVISLFVVFLKAEVSPAYAALALALAMQLSGLYQYVVRLGCDLETRFTSVERIHSYSEELESEAPSVIDKSRPSPDWPTRGRICFIDVKMRYRAGLPLALKGLSFDVEPLEKIGIVGRTGSGKSSVGAALFRLVELQSGNIFIDGINIKDLGLEDLRSRMSIIPQEPVLFQGTVRYNLDPFNEYEDDELWKVLERTHMKEKISSLDRGLEATVTEHGENFSVGEKQLLCMARALLRQTKIVLLDEATASVDSETDKLIHKTVQEIFSDSTVLTIAHRLTTVKNCDRIIVLSEGKIVEFDQPDVLLANPKSFFSRLMSTTGL